MPSPMPEVEPVTMAVLPFQHSVARLRSVPKGYQIQAEITASFMISCEMLARNPSSLAPLSRKGEGNGRVDFRGGFRHLFERRDETTE